MFCLSPLKVKVRFRRSFSLGDIHATHYFTKFATSIEVSLFAIRDFGNPFVHPADQTTFLIETVARIKPGSDSRALNASRHRTLLLWTNLGTIALQNNTPFDTVGD